MFSRITRSNIQERQKETLEFIWKLNTYTHNGVSYDNFDSLFNTATQWKTSTIFQQATGGTFPGFQNLVWLFLMQNPNFYTVTKNFYCALLPQIFFNAEGERTLFPGDTELWSKAFQELYVKLFSSPHLPIVIPITMGKEIKLKSQNTVLWEGHSVGLMILPMIRKIVVIDPDGFDNMAQDPQKRGFVEFTKVIQTTISQVLQTPYELVLVPTYSLQQDKEFEDTACAIWTTWIMINILHGCDIRNPAMNTPEYHEYRVSKQKTSANLVSFVCDAILIGLQYAKKKADTVSDTVVKNQLFVHALVEFLIDVSAVKPEQVQKMTEYLECQN